MNNTEKKLIERIENWKKSLLDMSRRNLMLWYRPRKVGSLELTVEVFDEEKTDLDEEIENLISGETWSFISQVPEYIAEIDDEIEDLLGLAAQDEEIKKQKAYATMIKTRAKALKAIMRRDKQENDEKGLNVSYIATGFLEWYESESSDIKIESPLIMIPIKITQESRLSPFLVNINPDEDIVMNPVVLKKLRDDFNIDIESLAADGAIESNIPLFLKKLNDAVQRQPRWNITKRTVIDTFQFQNLAIWNDLDKNADLVSGSPFGQILAGEELVDAGITYSEEEIELDKIKSRENVCILEADSSQMEAIRRAHNGESFVIQGPPGTGKSQTITNIIADQLYQGKKILFVSEKQAALDVVYHKLEQNGLADFCLIMHNANQKKANVREQLQKSLNLSREMHRRVTNDTMSTYTRLDDQVKKLNLYTSKLHDKCLDGTTIYQIFGKTAVLEKYPNLIFQMPENFDWDIKLDAIEGMFAAIEKYGEAFVDDTQHFRNNYWQYYTGNFDGSTGRVVNDAKNDFNSYKVHDMLEDIREKVSSRADLKELLTGIKDIRIRLEILPFQQADTDEITQGITDIEKIDATIRAKQQEHKEERRVITDEKSEIREKMKNIDEDVEDLITEIKENFTNDFLKINDAEDLYRKLTNKYSHFYQRTSKVYKELAGELDHYATTKMNYAKYVKYLGKRIELDQLKEKKRVAKKDLEKLQEKIESRDQTFEKTLDKLRDNFTRRLEEVIENTASQLNGIDDLLEKLDFGRLSEYQHYQQARTKVIEEYDLKNFVEKIEESDQVFSAEDISKIFQKRFYHLYLERTDFIKDYHTYLRVDHDKDIDIFREYDNKARQIAKERIRCELMSKLPDVSGFTNRQQGGEISVLRRELQKKTRLMPTRKLFEKLPVIIPQLKPCMMMSPLTVSSYFGTNINWKFDIVIFDEASQVRSEYAVPSIVRGKQIIVAGDAKQMQPSRFFDVSTDDDTDYDDEDDDTKDLESILDEMSARLPDKCLNWHYRSRDESLITFSNNKFYNNRLHTFPSATKNDKNLGVDYIYCPEGIWESRNGNRPEAELVAKLVFDHAKSHPDKTLGVVAFGSSQETAIIEAIDKVRDMHPELEEFFSENNDEPFFVKNLENVQGDERDRIILSCGYGKDANGVFAMRFGPLATTGGERRLNVAVSRAKEKMTVVSSFKANEIREADENHRARKLIRDFIDYAERGEIALLGEDELKSSDEDSYVPEFDSDFERDVYDFLISEGYELRTQVGASGYRIDIGVFHPDIEGRYLIAIECDGASYHSSASARDRDILRQEILENLGWRFYRIWSVDWIYNNAQEKKRLLQAIKDAIRDYNSPKKPSDNEQRQKVIKENMEDFGINEVAANGITFEYERKDIGIECKEIRNELKNQTGLIMSSDIFEHIACKDTLGSNEKMSLSDVLRRLIKYRNGYSDNEFFREVNERVFLKTRLTSTTEAKFRRALKELIDDGTIELVNESTIRVL